MAHANVLVALASLLALDGCAVSNPGLQHLNSASRDEAQEYLEAADLLERAENHLADGMPTELVDLEQAYASWSFARTSLLEFVATTSFRSGDVGDCLTGKRNASEHCSKANAAIGNAETVMAEILTAAIDAEPSTTNEFPARQLVENAVDATLTSKLDLAESIETLTTRQESYFTRRMKKAGGATSYVRKERTGMCFFATTADSLDTEPSFLLDPSSESVFVRCIAPDPLRSYARSMNDAVVVEILGLGHPIVVKEMSVADMSPDESIEIELPMASVAKAARNVRPVPFIALQVSYVVGNEDSISTATSKRRRSYAMHNIRYRSIARGIAMVQLAGAQDEGEVAATRGDKRGGTSKRGETSKRNPKPRTATRKLPSAS